MKPNIIFILADDLGWGDLGCFGSPINKTPNIDALASDGIRFTNAYSSSAVCSPTRISLYTGSYPGRFLVGLQEPIVIRNETTGIPNDYPTIPKILKSSGYKTAMFGKWHCGPLPWYSPIKAGFDDFFGNIDGALDYFSHINMLGEKDLYEGEVPVDQVGYYTDLITERSIDYISASKDAPFYLQINYTTPHFPFLGPEDKEISEEISKLPLKEASVMLQSLGSVSKYKEMVESLDVAVGRILSAIKEKNIEQNTVVIFSSDNGGERFSFLFPLSGEKGDLEEGGIRVPTIIRWLGTITPEQVTDIPIITMDLSATILDIAETKQNESYHIDGISLLPWLLKKQNIGERVLFWRSRQQGAVRYGRFKLLYERTPRPRGWGRQKNIKKNPKLFDLEIDERERVDVSWKYPEIVDKLFSLWKDFDEEMLSYDNFPKKLEKKENS